MTALAEGLGAAGVRVARFEFPYMRQIRAGANQRPPDKAALLQQTWLEVLEHLGSGWVIGGKSLGGLLTETVIRPPFLGPCPLSPVSDLACLYRALEAEPLWRSWFAAASSLNARGC